MKCQAARENAAIIAAGVAYTDVKNVVMSDAKTINVTTRDLGPGNAPNVAPLARKKYSNKTQ